MAYEVSVTGGPTLRFENPPTDADIDEAVEMWRAEQPTEQESAQQERGRAFAQGLSSLVTGMPTEEEAGAIEAEEAEATRRRVSGRLPQKHMVGFPAQEVMTMGPVPPGAQVVVGDTTPEEQERIFRTMASQQRMATQRGRMQALEEEGVPAMLEAGKEAIKGIAVGLGEAVTLGGLPEGSGMLGTFPVFTAQEPVAAAREWMETNRPGWYQTLLDRRRADIQDRAGREATEVASQDVSDMMDAMDMLMDLAQGERVFAEEGGARNFSELHAAARESVGPMATEVGRSIAVDLEAMAEDPVSYAKAEPIDTAIAVGTVLGIPAISAALKAAAATGRVSAGALRGLRRAYKAAKDLRAEGADLRKMDEADALADGVQQIVDMAEQAQVDEAADATRAVNIAAITDKAIDASADASPSMTPAVVREAVDELAAPDVKALAYRDIAETTKRIEGEAPPPPPEAPPRAGGGPPAQDPAIRSAQHMATRTMRKLLDLPGIAEATGATRRSLQVALDEAKDLIGLGRAADGEEFIEPTQRLMDVLEEARAGQHILNDTEQFAATMLAKTMEDDLIAERAAFAKGMADNVDESASRTAQMSARGRVKDKHGKRVKAAEDALDGVLAALERSGTEWGRAGRSRRAFLAIFRDLDETQVIDIATVQKGSKLTPDEKALVKTRFKDAKVRKERAHRDADDAVKLLEKLDQAEADLGRSGLTPGQVKAAKKRLDKERSKVERKRVDAGRDAAIAAGQMDNAANFGFWSKTADWLSTSRALNATLDMSAIGRQAIGLFKAHPILGAKAMQRSFRAAWGEDAPAYAAQLQREFVDSGLGKFADDANLYTSDVEGVRGTGVLGREEAYIGNTIEDAGYGVGSVIRWSERNYATMLNQIRREVFDKWTRLDGKGSFWTKKAYGGGAREDADGILRVSAEDAKELARIINISTGRGDVVERLGELTEKAGLASPASAKMGPKWVNRASSTVFFAPKFAASRLQDPFVQALDLLSIPLDAAMKGVGKEAIGKSGVVKARQLERLLREQAANATLVATTSAMMSDKPFSEAMADFYNPDSPDFLRIVVPMAGGDRRFDVSGGVASTWRYLPNPLTMAFSSSASEAGEMSSSRFDRLLWNKAIGPLGALYSGLQNKGWDGKELTDEMDGVLEHVAKRVVIPAAKSITPIMAQTFVQDAIKIAAGELGLGEAAVAGAAEFLGVSNYTRPPKKKKPKRRYKP
jgi:hypothetical protein